MCIRTPESEHWQVIDTEISYGNEYHAITMYQENAKVC